MNTNNHTSPKSKRMVCKLLFLVIILITTNLPLLANPVCNSSNPDSLTSSFPVGAVVLLIAGTIAFIARKVYLSKKQEIS